MLNRFCSFFGRIEKTPKSQFEITRPLVPMSHSIPLPPALNNINKNTTALTKKLNWKHETTCKKISPLFIGNKLCSKPIFYSFMDMGSFFRDGKILAIGFSFLTQHLLPPLQQYV